MEKSCSQLPKNFVEHRKRDIDAHFTDAIPLFSDKALASWADTTPETVANWRARRSSPRFANAIKVAQRVPQLKAAIIELLGDPRIQNGPAPERLITPLFNALLEIARSSDEIAARRAQDALREFAEVATPVLIDGGGL